MQPIIELEHISRTFLVKRLPIKAVDDVSLAVNEGEVVCLVGESGCGKTTTGRIATGLLAPSSGRILYRGKDIARSSKEAFHSFRLAAQMVHQDPYASLNPAHSVYEIISTPLRHHGFVKTEADARRRVCELLELVDLTPPHDLLDKFPHQLSGGQRQRVSVARVLTVNPAFIVADEAVSMVDVSIRISLLNMLTRLRDKMGVTFLFITHDLALAKYFAWRGRIGVMYLGRLVEVAPARQLVEHPRHPYTQVLLSAIPEADPELTRRKQPIGLRSMDVPSLLRLPGGCAFHPRCPRFAGEQCEKVVPELRSSGESGVACHVA